MLLKGLQPHSLLAHPFQTARYLTPVPGQQRTGSSREASGALIVPQQPLCRERRLVKDGKHAHFGVFPDL
jgi:hypothetical protein